MDNNSTSNDHGFIGTGTPYFYPDDGTAPFSLVTLSAVRSVLQAMKRYESHDVKTILARH